MKHGRFFFLGPMMCSAHWLIEHFFPLSTNADEENLVVIKKLLSNYEQTKAIYFCLLHNATFENLYSVPFYLVVAFQPVHLAKSYRLIIMRSL